MTDPVPQRLAARALAIEPFHTMELLKRAHALERDGRSIIHMDIGEPDFTAAPPVVAALAAAVAAGQSRYTAALGIMPLREAIAAFYAQRFGVAVDAERVVVTAGASGALLLCMAALIDAGQELLMPDPSYPCNRHFVTAFDGLARLVPAGPPTRFQLTGAMVEAHWSERTRGVLIASPSNPTGTSLPPPQMAGVIEAVRQRHGITIVDEIYLALSYEAEPASVLALVAAAADDVFVINSFSKYFNMTGWRLGWLIAPRELVPVFEKLSQNLYICPSALAQQAALACFLPDSLALYEERRAEFRRRRDFIVPALRALGFGVPIEPDGAFYVYADCTAFTDDSAAFADELLVEAGVGLVPGKDFGQHAPERWLRLSYATSMQNLEEAVARLERHLRHRARRGA